MMTCDEMEGRIHDFVDGALAPPALREVEAHLADCPHCRALEGEIRGLLAEAAGLPRSIEPPRDLWPGIDARIRAAGPARRAFPWRGLAAAALLAVATAGTHYVVSRAPLHPTPSAHAPAPLPAPLAAAEEDYRVARDTLLHALRSGGDALSVETRTAVEENLAIIDGAMHSIRAALADAPGDPRLMELLAATREKELSLLQRIVELQSRS